MGPPGSVDAGSVTGPLYWTATGGTVARSAQDRSADVANVLDFGADPTGVVDSSAAINAAASQLSPDGGRLRAVYLPTGKYLIRHQIILTKGQAFYGDAQGASVLVIDETFDAAASSVILCTASLIDPGSTIRDLYFYFVQPSTASSRSTFKTLAAGGTSHEGGTGVQYPWAIATSGNSGRIQVLNVCISGAWNGINADGACFWIDGLKLCAFNIGIAIGGTLAAPVADWAHLSDIEFWVFGLNTSQLQGVYTDGQTIAMRIGGQNGLTAQNISCFTSRLVFTADAAAGWFSFTNLGMDAGQATIEIADCFFLQITNFYTTAGSDATKPLVSFAGGRSLAISNWYAHNSSPFPIYSQTGGQEAMIANAQFVVNASAVSAVFINAGGLRLTNSKIYPSSASAWTQPLVAQFNTGRLQVDNLDLQGNAPSGTGVYFDTDNPGNIQANVVLGSGWSNSHPGGAVNGVYGLLSLTASKLRGTTSYANDAAAAAGGVGPDELYRNGSQVMVRVT
jgi:hypothetical protein